MRTLDSTVASPSLVAGGPQAARILRLCSTVELRANEACSADGVSEAKLLLVERGLALLVARRPGWRRPVVVSLGGAGTFLPGLEQDEQLVGLIETVVRVIPAGVCRALLSLPAAAEAIVDGLLAALCDRQESLASATGSAHAERLRGKLLQLARSHGTVGPGGIEIALPLTHELLGQMIGSARETVTTTVGRLERDGFLVRNGRGYRIPPPH